MDKKSVIKKIEDYVRVEMGDEEKDVHGWGHVFRVRKWAFEINKKEKLVDPFILEVTALLHDIGRGDKQEKDHCLAGKKIVLDYLPSLNYFSEQEIKQIAQGVLEHGQGGDNDLADILQDADRLDFAGAIGLTRVSMHQHDRAVCKAEKDFERRDYSQEEVDHFIRLPKSEKSLVEVFNLQLSILRNQMNTKTGKELAQERIKFNENFLVALKKDLLF